MLIYNKQQKYNLGQWKWCVEDELMWFWFMLRDNKHDVLIRNKQKP